jgi:hypothetical protein
MAQIPTCIGDTGILRAPDRNAYQGVAVYGRVRSGDAGSRRTVTLLSSVTRFRANGQVTKTVMSRDIADRMYREIADISPGCSPGVGPGFEGRSGWGCGCCATPSRWRQGRSSSLRSGRSTLTPPSGCGTARIWKRRRSVASRETLLGVWASGWCHARSRVFQVVVGLGRRPTGLPLGW